MSKYPRDEFDGVPEASGRPGIHRVQTKAATSRGLGPVVAAGCLALLIGFVSFFVMPRLGFSPENADAASAASAAPTAAGAPTGAQPDSGRDGGASATGAANPGKQDDADSGSKPDSSKKNKDEGRTSEPVDKSAPVAVLNSTPTSGLAAAAAGSVRANGWTVVTVANWTGPPRPTSVIFFASPAQKANAEALGQLLGIPTLVQTPLLVQPLTVVIGPGFRG